MQAASHLKEAIKMNMTQCGNFYAIFIILKKHLSLFIRICSFQNLLNMRLHWNHLTTSANTLILVYFPQGFWHSSIFRYFLFNGINRFVVIFLFRFPCSSSGLTFLKKIFLTHSFVMPSGPPALLSCMFDSNLAIVISIFCNLGVEFSIIEEEE